MSVKGLIKWLRSRHGDLNQYGDRLREKVVRTPPGAREKWIEDLRSRFDAFATCFQQQLASEEEGGYLAPLADARPTVAEAVTVLQREHLELTRIIDRLRSTVRALTPQSRLVLRDCCARIEDLLFWVERHEEHENHLMLYAFSEEAKAEG